MCAEPQLTPHQIHSSNIPKHTYKPHKQTSMASYVRSLISYAIVQFDTRVANQETREQFYKQVVILSRQQPFIAVSRGYLPSNLMNIVLIISSRGVVVPGDPVNIWDTARPWVTRLRLRRGWFGSWILCFLDWIWMYASLLVSCRA